MICKAQIYALHLSQKGNGPRQLWEPRMQPLRALHVTACASTHHGLLLENIYRVRTTLGEPPLPQSAIMF